MPINVYGESNDTVIIAGYIEGKITNPNMDKDHPGILLFDNGTILKIWYDIEGIWRIETVGMTRNEQIYKCSGLNDDDYSDIAIIKAKPKLCYYLDKYIEFKALDNK